MIESDEIFERASILLDDATAIFDEGDPRHYAEAEQMVVEAKRLRAEMEVVNPSKP